MKLPTLPKLTVTQWIAAAIAVVLVLGLLTGWKPLLVAGILGGVLFFAILLYLGRDPLDVGDLLPGPGYAERLEAQHKALEADMDRLAKFMDTPDYERLPLAERELIVRQAGAMSVLGQVLDARMLNLRGGLT